MPVTFIIAYRFLGRQQKLVAGSYPLQLLEKFGFLATVQLDLIRLGQRRWHT